MALPPSGEQWTIAHDKAQATIVEVGGGIREYRLDGIDVLDPFPVEAMCDGAHNMPLVPWPNRISKGRYRFDGEDYQVALTEPAQNNAIHGFGRWANWVLREHDANRIVVGLRIPPQTGYPFLVDVSVEYTLDDTGLTTRITGHNLGENAAPWACGQHPYLRCDTDTIDALEVELKAAKWLPTDTDQIPTGKEPVEGSDYDFRTWRKLGHQKIDYAFNELERDEAGRAWARVRAPSGREVGLWADEHFPFLELYTGDTLAPHRQRRGLGVEPMSAAPNGFATGDGLARLEPDEAVTATWGIVVS
jgi:aldose 1-epimerase